MHFSNKAIKNKEQQQYFQCTCQRPTFVLFCFVLLCFTGIFSFVKDVDGVRMNQNLPNSKHSQMGGLSDFT